VLTDAVGQVFQPCEAPPRIVSLVPSLTELLFDLGLAENIVGRTRFCLHPRELMRTLPKVGGTKDVDLGKLRSLRPSHVVVNVDENRIEQVNEIRMFVPNVIVTHPMQPDDNLDLFRLFGGLFAVQQRAEELAMQLQSALQTARGQTRQLAQENVVYCIWKDPWMTVAPNTYISAMLRVVGWHTMPESAAARYPTVDFNAAWLHRVDRIFLSSEPYRFRHKHLQAASRLPGFAGKKIQLIDGELVSWYGSRAAAGLRYLASLRTGAVP
jgi:ABC-type Fe3+-hydroxamate transport system substrate-binding protein